MSRKRPTGSLVVKIPLRWKGVNTNKCSPVTLTNILNINMFVCSCDRTYKNNIPPACVFPRTLSLFLFRLDGRSDYESLLSPQTHRWKKTLHIQSCMLSDHRVMQLAPMAQLRLLYVSLTQKSRWALTDRRCPWIESVQSVRCACFAVTAGWHRSCGWSLDNHMISLCRFSGGSTVWWNHSFISTAHLL